MTSAPSGLQVDHHLMPRSTVVWRNLNSSRAFVGSMKASFADFEQSLARAPARARVLVALASLSVTYRGPLAKAASVQWGQLRGILWGDPPRYRQERALVWLGLAAVEAGPNGLAVTITEKGRRKARQLTARSVRADIRRRAIKREMDAAPVAESERGGSWGSGFTVTVPLVLPVARFP